jgi:hypothetical protein
MSVQLFVISESILICVSRFEVANNIYRVSYVSEFWNCILPVFIPGRFSGRLDWRFQVFIHFFSSSFGIQLRFLGWQIRTFTFFQMVWFPMQLAVLCLATAHRFLISFLPVSLMWMFRAQIVWEGNCPWSSHSAGLLHTEFQGRTAASVVVASNNCLVHYALPCQQFTLLSALMCSEGMYVTVAWNSEVWPQSAG